MIRKAVQGFMVKVYILSDNRVAAPRPMGLQAEWGFSALVELDDQAVLLDAGQTGVAAWNAALMMAPVHKISAVVVSHGHYDHTGGLYMALKGFPFKPKLYLHPDAWLPRYFKGDFIGMPWSHGLLASIADIHEHREPVKVAANAWALGEVPRKHSSVVSKDMVIERNGKLEKDQVLDDQSLAVKTEDGVLLVLGCCHAGLRNTVEYAEEVVGDQVKYIIGGTHLMALKPEEVKETAYWLKSRGVELVAACHCTGPEAELILATVLGGKFKPVGVGTVIEVPPKGGS